MKPMHKGVGLLISNKDQSRFFIQQKDETYPFEIWRGCCSFWGGAIEDNDLDELAAVNRELEEELPLAFAMLQTIPPTLVGKYNIPTVDSSFDLTVFEIRLSNDQLAQLAKTKVLEGNGILFSREKAMAQKWIWDTDFIFHDFINQTSI